ncbi:unnamed protein product, partial [Mesorhabditis belari]|uniref:G-protein coupled receptors family 1 profile domain-containing protein n=1 Tax=Mesorhabditis belari TaxID=2138241 RepID=A0AAF3EEC8_9BILA
MEWTDELMVGITYVIIGFVGFVCNLATVVMIGTNRVYRLSAYTIMANVALADAIMMLIAGVACGCSLLWPGDERLGSTLATYKVTGNDSMPDILSIPINTNTLGIVLSLCEIAAWIAGVVSYALLGLNRCIAICYYGTKARALNRVSIAIVGSIFTWVIGIAIAILGSMPEPLMGIRRDMWSFSFLQTRGDRPQLFLILMLVINGAGVGAQWICSSLVLLRIHRVKQKISRNKINQNSANRFKKQARLTFQFFYPSLLCTIASLVYFCKPYVVDRLSAWQFVGLHLIWLCNHACNPFIYAYFNDRMRLTYREMLTCAQLRYHLRKRRISRGFRHNPRHNVSRRSNAPKSTRMSARSVKSRDGNFVRNSLQLQSRDFEQLCEFIMRVNPLYDSSEGWRESSDEEDFAPEMTKAPESTCGDGDSSAAPSREPRSIVLDLGRQTVEHWVRFAKKASI